MQVQPSGLTQNLSICTNSINRSLQSSSPAAGSKAAAMRQDTVSISPKGRIANLTESFVKQKESILKQKEELIKSTLANGGDLENIKEPLSFMNDQLDAIEKSMTQAIADELKRIADEQLEKSSAKSNSDTEEKTEEELEAEKLSSVVRLSGEIDRAKTISAVQTRMGREAKTEKSHIQQSQKILSAWETRSKHSGAGGAEKLAIQQNKAHLAAKASQADTALNQAQKLSAQAAGILHGVNQAVKGNTQEQTAPAQEALPPDEQTAPEFSVPEQTEPKSAQ